MPPFFKKGANQIYVCKHCSQTLTATRGGFKVRGLTLCVKSPTRKHERNELPSGRGK